MYFIVSIRTHRAKSSGVIGFGYACSMSSNTFSAVNGTTSYCESSNDTVMWKMRNYIKIGANTFVRRTRNNIKDQTMVNRYLDYACEFQTHQCTLNAHFKTSFRRWNSHFSDWAIIFHGTNYEYIFSLDFMLPAILVTLQLRRIGTLWQKQIRLRSKWNICNRSNSHREQICA